MNHVISLRHLTEVQFRPIRLPTEVVYIECRIRKGQELPGVTQHLPVPRPLSVSTLLLSFPTSHQSSKEVFSTCLAAAGIEPGGRGRLSLKKLTKVGEEQTPCMSGYHQVTASSEGLEGLVLLSPSTCPCLFLYFVPSRWPCHALLHS